MVVADQRVMARRLAELRARLLRSLRAHLAEDEATLASLRARFSHFRLALAEREQAVDDLAQRIEQAVRRSEAKRRGEIERLHRRLAARHPRAVIARSRAELGPLEVRLEGAARMTVDRARAKLGERLARLDAMSPLAVLGRGYAIATTESGRAIRAASEVARGDRISIRVHRGAFSAKVEGAAADEPKAAGTVLEERT
jgi:exodeoxyribonuclease VII large subunit